MAAKLPQRHYSDLREYSPLRQIIKGRGSTTQNFSRSLALHNHQPLTRPLTFPSLRRTTGGSDMTEQHTDPTARCRRHLRMSELSACLRKKRMTFCQPVPAQGFLLCPSIPPHSWL